MERCCECWKGFSKTVQALIITSIVLAVIGIGIGIGFGANSSKGTFNNDVPRQRPKLTFTEHQSICKYSNPATFEQERPYKKPGPETVST